MYCRNCGNKLDENAYVCVNCGVLVDSNINNSIPSRVYREKKKEQKKIATSRQQRSTLQFCSSVCVCGGI